MKFKTCFVYVILMFVVIKLQLDQAKIVETAINNRRFWRNYDNPQMIMLWLLSTHLPWFTGHGNPCSHEIIHESF